MRHSLLAITVALLSLGIAPGSRATSTLCDAPGTALIAETGGVIVAIDPATGTSLPLPDPASPAGRARAVRLAAGNPWPPRWDVARTSDDTGSRFAVTDVLTDSVVLDERFGRRIELEASAVTATGRYTLHVQGNNVATEVTILDAVAGEARLVRVPHHAELAPFAIGIAFSPDGSCAALTMERVGGSGPETWLIELAIGQVRALDTHGAFIAGWQPYRPGY